MISEQQLGLIDSKDSIIQIGKEVQAEKVLVGKVFRIGNEYRFTVKIIDINQNTEDLDGEEISAGKSREQIDAAIDSLVDKLDTKAHSEKRLTRTGILWRSAILPGWGQLSSGRASNDKGTTIKGGVMIGVGILLFYNLYSSDVAYKSSKNSYDSATTINLGMSLTGQYTSALGFATFAYANGERSKMDSNASKAQGASLLFVAYYLYNLVDAYYFSGGVSRAALLEPKNGFQLYSYNENYYGMKNVQTNFVYQFRF